MSHTGTCFCGAVELEVTGSPEAMGYCHCRSCRSWSGGPVNAFSLWKPDAVKVKKGAEHVGQDREGQPAAHHQPDQRPQQTARRFQQRGRRQGRMVGGFEHRLRNNPYLKGYSTAECGKNTHKMQNSIDVGNFPTYGSFDISGCS